MCVWKEVFDGLSSMTSSICSIFVKQADVDGKKIELEMAQIREKLKITVDNHKMLTSIEDLRKSFEDEYNKLLQSHKSNENAIGVINATLNEMETQSRKLIEDFDQLKKDQKNIVIAVGGITVVIGGILLYQFRKQKNKTIVTLPDDFETKQKVLEQLKTSRQAFTECQKLQELLQDSSSKNCNDLFGDFLRTEKLFREAFGEQKI